jgi:HTH-type transcriptional regulator/antitoxin HigA
MSNNTTEHPPRKATHPGTVLQRELEAREMKQSDLAAELDIAASHLNEIIKGKRPITAELAVLLEAALEIDAEYWNNAQASYNLDVARVQASIAKQADVIAQWRAIKDIIPLKYFKKQGVIIGNIAEDVKRVFSLFAIDSVTELQQRLAVGGGDGIYYKKSGKLKTHVEHMKAWVAYVRHLSEDVRVNPFDFDCQADLIKSLRKVFLGHNIENNLATVLCSYGIKLVVKEKPDHAPIDGAALWSKDMHPIIGLTLRHKRIDNLAFTVYHELGHIFLHLKGNQKVSYVDNTVEDAQALNSDVEKEANEFAGNILIPEVKWQEFIHAGQSFDDNCIKRFAASIGTPAASVRGRLCHEKFLAYSRPTSIDYHIL